MTKKMMAPLLIILLIMGWITTIQGFGKNEKEYSKHIAQAEAYEEKGIYIDALSEYQEAVKYTKQPFDIQTKIMDTYLLLGKESDFVKYGEELIKEYNYPESIVMKLVDYYTANKREQYAVELINEALKKNPNNAVYAQELVDLRGTYSEKYIGKGEIDIFYNSQAVIMDDGLYGLIDLDGTKKIKPKFDFITPYGSDPEYAAVKEGDSWYYIDKQGYKKLVPDMPVDSLGLYGDGYAAYGKDGKYGYVDRELAPVTEITWDAVTAFANKRAAVCKDGKWAIIDTNFEQITDYIYDDVIRNTYELCSEYSVYIAKQNGKYHVYNLSGEQLGSVGFDDARAFASDEPAAVLVGDLWGFVGTDGEIKIEPQYKDADSFSCELAPILVNDVWGYVDIENKIRINPVFIVAKTFSPEGYAPVQTNSWKIIKLIK